MEPLCQKCFLQLAAPSEADPRDEKQRLLDALPEDFGRIRMALPVMRQLHSVCREGGWQVTVTLSWTGSGWEAVNLEPGDTSGKNYGICVDLGSTTICMRLVDLSSGRTMGQVSAYNRQIAFGEDILTRVFSSKDSPQTLEALRQATLDTFREALEQLEEQTGYPVKSCGAMTVAGNTTMMHFLFGLDAFGVFASPYAPCAMRFDPYPARDAGIPLDGYLYCYPCRANYLGGDIISGLIATSLIRESEICVFLDIGTNGELVVGNREFLMAGAGAAGPALEGGVVKTGMRAVEGAVSYVRMEGEKFYLTVIGGGAPKGVCGSGIVDLIAQLYLNGKIDLRGKFIPESGGLEQREGEWAICYAPGLYFYQSDIDAFLRTKAAANTMVEYMLDALGVSLDQVHKFYVAGAFGTFLDPESAVTVGLYPDLPRDRIISAGNTSLEGAHRLLCDRHSWEEVDQILNTMEYVQFGEVADFIDRMAAAGAIPHTDLSRYPSVRRNLMARGLL